MRFEKRLSGVGLAAVAAAMALLPGCMAENSAATDAGGAGPTGGQAAAGGGDAQVGEGGAVNPGGAGGGGSIAPPGGHGGSGGETGGSVAPPGGDGGGGAPVGGTPDTGSGGQAPPADAGPGADALPPDAFAPPGDRDDDGIADVEDNCPGAPNHNQADTDGDTFGDACDVCPEVADPDQADQDADGRGDVCDDDDSDGDGRPDRMDICPLAFDPAQADADSDGVGDACDNCPALPNFTQSDDDGDGVGNACEVAGDDDADGVADAQDNCPAIANRDQADPDADGRGTACDNCPRVPNFAQADADGDGIGDACEGVDTDADGLPDGADNCPTAPNADQSDRDGDGPGDLCDTCVFVVDPAQADADGDGEGDVCDTCPHAPNPDQNDSDGDGPGDACDNCPFEANPNQADADRDGVGDACEQPVIDLRVEATWENADVDLDLHLIDSLGVWYDNRHDLHFVNRDGVPFARATDIVDATRGPGPETLTADGMAPGIYHLGVFFYGDRANLDPNVTVSVQCGENAARVFGPQVLREPNDNGSPADLWQVVAISYPDCTFIAEPGPAVVSLSNCGGNGAACGANCADCVQGICFGNACGDVTCDPYNGECIDRCAGVQCGAEERCAPETGLCVPRTGFCDACEADQDCGIAGATICVTNPLNTAEHFCSRSCENLACPNGYVCAVDLDGNAICLPELGTCTDRCEGVECGGIFGAGMCEPVTGECTQDTPCHFNQDCGNGYCYLSDARCVPYGAGASALGGACQATSDCAANLACRLEASVCVRSCDVTADCPANQHCSISADGQVRYCIPN